MRKHAVLIILFCLFGANTVLSQGINPDKKRAKEIENQMWRQSGSNFRIVETPEKWNDETAIIIAKEHFLSYRKEPIVNNLHYDRYNHWRIKLQSSSALEEYSEFSVVGSGTYSNLKFNFYAGFKVIKPSGEEIIIPLSNMVKEKAQINRSNLDTYKIAIPGLEINDIIDYYIAEEREINLYSTRYYSFDPAIFVLNDSYPVMHQKITFDVLRRCFINAKTLNGAPEFELSQDESNDKTKYTLVDENRERVDEVRWLHKYRAIPTVKFKVTYASSMAASSPTFIGTPGVLKSEVSKSELLAYLKYAFPGTSNSSNLSGLMKKYYKSEKDKEKLAERAFYALRFIHHPQYWEKSLLNYGAQESPARRYKFISELSNYYKFKNIKHQILIGIPRYISKIEDLILENELAFMIKVNVGDEPVYVSYFDTNAYYGEIDSDLQGVEVYAVDGLMPRSGWSLKRISVPMVDTKFNRTVSDLDYEIADLKEGQFSVKAKKSILGAAQDYYHSYLTDFYTLKKEEFDQFPEEEEFTKTSKKKMDLLLKKRKDYMIKRDESFNENLKIMVENDLELEVEKVSNLEVIQTGRFHDAPEFIYSYEAELKGGLKKVGNNYILEIGKLIDEQIEINDQTRSRDYDIYMPYARSFEYNINIQIPEGYEIQGLDKLNINVTNETGSFTSQAEINGNRLKLTTSKSYSSNFEKKENWNLMLEFLEAADQFNSSKVLLKKI